MSEVTNSILFRQQLYEKFKESGLLSQLKTTLRTNLLERLQKPQVSQINNVSSQQTKKPLHRRDKFLASIVRQYLIKSKKEYTHSILLPQSQLEDEYCLNFDQMSEIVNLQKANVRQGAELSFLESLVNQWVRLRDTDICQRSTQTDYSEPVSKKLQDIQKQYRPKMEYWKLMSGPKVTPIDDISLIAKEERIRQQFQIEKKRIRRDLQLSVKAQVQKKFQSQFDFRIKEMQKQHEGRLVEIKNREKGIIQSLQRKTKQIQEKSKAVNEKQMNMIKKYEQKSLEMEIQHRKKIKEIEQKQKEFWKKQLELKAKKRQYQDSIRLVKQKIISQTLNPDEVN